MALTARAAETARAFDAVAGTYGEVVGSNPLFEWMRQHARTAVTTRVAPGGRVLELGCGPGLDAVWFATRGYRVTALDLSAGMVQETSQRARKAGVEARVRATRLAIEEVHSLPAGRFAVVYAGLGPLNCVELCPRIVSDIAARVEMGGFLVTTAMGRLCPWDWARYGSTGQFARAFIRLRKEPTDLPLGGGRVRTHYYRPKELARAFERTGLQLIERRGLGLFVPPAPMRNLTRWQRRALARVLALEDRVGTWPAVREIGDHFLLVMRRVDEVPGL